MSAARPSKKIKDPFVKEHLATPAYKLAKKLKLLDGKPHEFIKTKENTMTDVLIQLEKIQETKGEEKKTAASSPKLKFNYKGNAVFFKITEAGGKEGYTILFESKVAIGWEMIVNGSIHNGGRQGLFSCKFSQAECVADTPSHVEELQQIAKLLKPR